MINNVDKWSVRIKQRLRVLQNNKFSLIVEENVGLIFVNLFSVIAKKTL